MIHHQASPPTTGFYLDIDQVPDNLINVEDQWEFELEVIGAAATPQQLEDLLHRAPNPESAAAQFLLGYLASHANRQT